MLGVHKTLGRNDVKMTAVYTHVFNPTQAELYSLVPDP